MENPSRTFTKFTKLEILEIKESDISDYLKNKILDEILEEEEQDKKKEKKKKEKKGKEKKKELIILSSSSSSTAEISEEEETKKLEIMTSSSELEKSRLKEIYENAIMKKPQKNKLLKDVNSEDVFTLLRTYQSQLDNFFIPEKNMKWIINIPIWKKTIIDAWRTHILFIYKIEKVHFFDKLLWDSSFQAIRFISVKNDRYIARLIRFDSKQLKYSEIKKKSTERMQMKQFSSKIITLYWTIIVGSIKPLIPIENIKSNFKEWYNEESQKMEDTSDYVKCDYNEETYYNCEFYSRPFSSFKGETKDLFYGEIENFLFDAQSFSSENIYKDKPVYSSIFHMDFYNNDAIYIFKRIEITEDFKSYFLTKYISGIEIFCISFVRLNFIVLDILEELGLSNVFKHGTPSSNSWINIASQRYENLLINETEEYLPFLEEGLEEEEEEGMEEENRSEIKIAVDNYVHEYVILLRKYLHLYLDMRFYLESKNFNVPEKIPNVYIDMKNVFWPIKSSSDDDINFKLTKLSNDHSTRIAYLMNFSQNQFSSFPMMQAFIYGSTDKLLETMHKKGEFNLAKVKKEENILPSLKEKKGKFQKKESKRE